MLIINGGIPRSGTVLVGNLVRLMLERRGMQWARCNPQEPRDLPNFLKLVQTAPKHPCVIIHTHLINVDIAQAVAQREDAVLLWNHRDPRDALVSLAKLHDLNLSHALHAIKVYAKAAKIALNTEECVEIRYDALIRDPQGHTQRLADVLGLQLEPGEDEALNQQTSVGSHTTVMARLSEGSLPGMRTLKTKQRTMGEDPTTLINDRHIQSGRTGRWQTELSESQQIKVHEALEHWISAFGYELS